MAKVQKKINNTDLPNIIGQTVVLSDATNVQKTVSVIANGPDGKTVLVKHNKEYFYVSNTYDPTKYLYSVNEV
jgi:hypothetical protein